jgi:hypothetical protein
MLDASMAYTHKCTHTYMYHHDKNPQLKYISCNQGYIQGHYNYTAQDKASRIASNNRAIGTKTEAGANPND